MKRTLIAVSFLSLPVSAAHAYDWSVQSSLSQSVELNDNQFLNPKPADSVGSYSALQTYFQSQGSTWRFVFDGNLRYSKYFGPGAADTPLSETLSSGVHARYEDFLKNSPDKNYIDATWSRQNTAFAILGNLGLATNAVGDINNTSLQGGIERSITRNDFVTWSARATSTDYDPSSAGTHFTDLETIATWRHQVDQRNALTASTEAEWLNYDNAQKTSTLIVRPTAGLQSDITPLLSFRGNAGVAFVNTDQSGPIITPTPPISGIGVSGLSEGFIGDALLTYKMFKTTQMSLYARQSIGPSVVGSLTQNTSFGANLVHTINYASSISFSGDATRQTASGTTTDFYSASVAYSYQLNRDWSTQLSYRYLHRPASNGSGAVLIDPVTGFPLAPAGNAPASSNSLLIVVTRNFIELPPGR